MEKILNVLEKLKISQNDFEFYGNDAVKINYSKYLNNDKGKLVLLTSINPTPAGEGKTTTAIGLADGLCLIGKNAILALREPSLGPVFGRKGTATGGGESEIVSTANVNLHFTGDFHAITTANNLVAAQIDSEIYWKTALKIDPKSVIWRRCLDLNDRSLREVEIRVSRDVTRTEKFTITAASHLMTILSLAQNLKDLRNRLNNSLVAYDIYGNEVFIKDLNIIGSLMAILKNAVKPNLTITKYNTPTLIHCGPFANIATGTNSIISTNLGLSISDYCVVETGFGSDLGFEKFMNLVNQDNLLIPDCTIMVVTIRALDAYNDFENNFDHLQKHIKHIKQYNLNLIVAINKMFNDNSEKLKKLQNWLDKNNYEWEINDAYNVGPVGARNLAAKVVKACDKTQQFKRLIGADEKVEEKIKKIVNNFYYLDHFKFTRNAQEKINDINKSIYANFPICMIKSHNSIDGNDTKQDNYELVIQDAIVNIGARFILVYTNNVVSMPGLSREPNSKKIDLKDDEIIGLS